jgi:hypothetical protein
MLSHSLPKCLIWAGKIPDSILQMFKLPKLIYLIWEIQALLLHYFSNLTFPTRLYQHHKTSNNIILSPKSDLLNRVRLLSRLILSCLMLQLLGKAFRKEIIERGRVIRSLIMTYLRPLPLEFKGLQHQLRVTVFAWEGRETGNDHHYWKFNNLGMSYTLH